VTKTALMGTSLVAAIPGGFLAYLTICAFVYHAEKMATMLQVVTGTTLVFSVLMALSPFAILLFVRTAAAAGSASDAAATPQPHDLSGLHPRAEGPAQLSEGDETVDEVFATGLEEEELGGAEGRDELAEVSADESSGSFELDDEEFEFDDEDLK
jgi:hypothetical protein